MTKRIVSKRTKLLFIGFGAMSIAAVCVVYSNEADRALRAKPQPQQHTIAAPATRPAGGLSSAM